ncbi:MAG: hypothetical protein HKN33_18555 [Pyrinomonadaceae bacterium]|nr:hypothetical protein [Pyrinomonadaceae bacterium]
MKDHESQHWDDPLPGFRWPTAVTHRMATPSERVWEVISTPGNLEQFHPFCSKNPVNNWPGEDSRDEVHYLNGWILERRFCNWIEGAGYDLQIAENGGKSSFVSWRVAPETSDSSILRIAIYPYVLQDIPSVVRWIPHLLRVHPMLKKYLVSVLRGFEWFVIRGEKVPRNQFGRHPWFSE